MRLTTTRGSGEKCSISPARPYMAAALSRVSGVRVNSANFTASPKNHERPRKRSSVCSRQAGRRSARGR